MKQHLIETESTNVWLMSLARERRRAGAPLSDMHAVYTDFQSAGRGAGTNKWHSSRGLNILASFYFETGLAASDQFLFNLWFATATRAFLARHAPEVRIKWPNDIYVRDHKLAGDLTEHAVSGGRLDFTVAGIGINVNETVFPSWIPNPTSLRQLTGNVYDVAALMDEYLAVLRERRPMLGTDHAAQLRDEYMTHLYRLHEPHPYLIKGQEMTCTLRDIDHFGRLVLELPDGTRQAFGFKEVGYVADSTSSACPQQGQ